MSVTLRPTQNENAPQPKTARNPATFSHADVLGSSQVDRSMITTPAGSHPMSAKKKTSRRRLTSDQNAAGSAQVGASDVTRTTQRNFRCGIASPRPGSESSYWHKRSVTHNAAVERRRDHVSSAPRVHNEVTHMRRARAAI